MNSTIEYFPYVWQLIDFPFDCQILTKIKISYPIYKFNFPMHVSSHCGLSDWMPGDGSAPLTCSLPGVQTPTETPQQPGPGHTGLSALRSQDAADLRSLLLIINN